MPENYLAPPEEDRIRDVMRKQLSGCVRRWRPRQATGSRRSVLTVQQRVSLWGGVCLQGAHRGGAADTGFPCQDPKHLLVSTPVLGPACY